MNQINEPQGNPEKIIAVFLALLGLSVPFFMDSVVHSIFINPERLLGEYLVYLIIGISLSFSFTKGYKPQVRAWVLLGMSALFLLFTLQQAYVNSVNINKGRKTANEIVTLMEDTNKQISGNPTKDNLEIKPINQSPSTVGRGGQSEAENFAILMQAIQPRVNRFAHEGLEINNKITNSGLDKVLQPNNLITASGIKSGRQTIQNFRLLLNSRNDLLANYYKDISATVDGLDFPQTTKQAFQKSFYENKPMLDYNYGELSRIGNLSMDCVEKILNLVEGHLGVITVNNGQLMFPDDTSANQYNEYIAEVIHLSEEEEKVTKLLAQKSSEHMESVKEKLRKL